MFSYVSNILFQAAYTGVRPEKPSTDWILNRIKNINQQEVASIERDKSDALDKAVKAVIRNSDYDLSDEEIREAKEMLLQLEEMLDQGLVSDRSGRGLFDLFVSLADMRHEPDTLIRGGNSTNDNNRGILDFVSEVAGTILGGVSNKNDGPVLIPNHCW